MKGGRIPDSVPLFATEVSGYKVGVVRTEPNGKGKPKAVALGLTLPGFGDVVVSLPSREDVDTMIAALEDCRDEVFPK